jgi:hypothetical protein
MNQKLVNQERLLGEALNTIEKMRMAERDFEGIDDRLLERLQDELAADYGYTMSHLVMAVVEELGYELRKKNENVPTLISQEVNN